jgi:glyoxylase-like metal-dependent hydrolase (beta-lactamase superfamily II)
LSAFDDLTFLAQENIAMDLYCAENTHRAAQDGFDLSGIPEPTTTIANIGFVDLGDFPVELAHFGQAQSRSDLIVGLPGRDILIVGDLVDSAPPQFDETSSLKGWVTALDSLYSLLKPDTVVIPGHGDLLGPPEVAHFRSGLAAIWDQSEWAYNQGIPLEKVYDHDNLQWPWDRPTAENAIRVGYRDLS